MKNGLFYCIFLYGCVKEYKMKRLGFLAIAFTAFLVACGDDSSSGPMDDPVSSSITPSSSSWSSEGSIGSSSSSVDSISSSSIRNGKESSSSSSETSASSSSQALIPPAEIVYGTLTDERDGKTYKTVTIGTQTWMAENLNYEADFSFCYNNKPENCAKYGRLYIWEAAMNSCPAGWGLPSLEEFLLLVANVGGREVAGKVLKSTDGWKDGGNGTDDFGFSALPAGYMYNDSTFYYEGEFGQFWSASGTSWMYQLELAYDRDTSFIFSLYREFAFSVRCLKGAGSVNEVKATPCKTDSTDTCEYGSVKDDRDGQTYKTVKIGDQWWMAQNLNYKAEDSFCADDSACARNGRFYTWAAAMDSAAKWSEGGKGCGFGSNCSPNFPVRGVCPSGWHLPSADELKNLRTLVGESGPAGTLLKSVDGWIGGFVNKTGGLIVYDSLATNGKGTDRFGFTALPTGYWDEIVMQDNGFVTTFWSSSEYEPSRATILYLSALMENTMIDSGSKGSARSVRCVKDAD